jgi:hypothetical protein
MKGRFLELPEFDYVGKKSRLESTPSGALIRLTSGRLE